LPSAKSEAIVTAITRKAAHRGRAAAGRLCRRVQHVGSVRRKGIADKLDAYVAKWDLWADVAGGPKAMTMFQGSPVRRENRGGIPEKLGLGLLVAAPIEAQGGGVDKAILQGNNAWDGYPPWGAEGI